MNKIKSSKGFTLMEMLIVVAIIAVLVAIAIPTFTTSLNKARVATDEANIRSGYAAFMAKIMSEDEMPEEDTKYYLNKDGTLFHDWAAGRSYQCIGNQTDPDFCVAGHKVGQWSKGNMVRYVITSEPDKSLTVKIEIARDIT